MGAKQRGQAAHAARQRAGAAHPAAPLCRASAARLAACSAGPLARRRQRSRHPPVARQLQAAGAKDERVVGPGGRRHQHGAGAAVAARQELAWGRAAGRRPFETTRDVQHTPAMTQPGETRHATRLPTAAPRCRSGFGRAPCARRPALPRQAPAPAQPPAGRSGGRRHGPGTPASIRGRRRGMSMARLQPLPPEGGCTRRAQSAHLVGLGVGRHPALRLPNALQHQRLLLLLETGGKCAPEQCALATVQAGAAAAQPARAHTLLPSAAPLTSVR